MGICDREFRLESVPVLFSWPTVVRFTSLLRGCCGVAAEEERMGAAEPKEKVAEGESRATLERGLPCWDRGRMDRRRIHEPADEMESRETSEMGAAQSAGRMNECRLEALGGVVWNAADAERGGRVELVVEPSGWRGRPSSSVSTVAAEVGAWYSEMDLGWWDGGRTVLDSAGWAKTRPAMATATPVPVPTSCRLGRSAVGLLA